MIYSFMLYNGTSMKTLISGGLESFGLVNTSMCQESDTLQTPRGQKLLLLGLFLTSPYELLPLAIHLYL